MVRKKTFYEIKYEKRSSDNAKLPSTEDLLLGWIIQAREKELERINQVTSWIQQQIDCLKQNVDKIQNDIIDRYQERLDKANQEITVDYEQQRKAWQPMKQKAKNLAEEFYKLEGF
jgi:peptidoglycan hydrolase CwlO-like protein